MAKIPEGYRAIANTARTHFMVTAGVFLVVAGLIYLTAGRAIAQQGPPPAHPAGTICFTPQLWCWAKPPGPPGTSCGCPSPAGWIAGIRG
jgi:hypothetical protein